MYKILIFKKIQVINFHKCSIVISKYSIHIEYSFHR